MNSLIKYFLKKILLITLLTPLFCCSQKPVFGIKLGLALSNSTIEYANPGNDNSSKPSTRTGVLGGVYVDIPAAKKLIMRPGVEVVTKGAVLNEYGYRDHYSLRFTYVDFPINILYKANFIKGHLLAGGGPSIGVPIKEPYSTYQLKTEFGINGLIGYEIPIGLSLNLNYNHGLSNASKSNDYVKKISNHYLGITVGYSF